MSTIYNRPAVPAITQPYILYIDGGSNVGSNWYKVEDKQRYIVKRNQQSYEATVEIIIRGGGL